jgi:putative endonuclease
VSNDPDTRAIEHNTSSDRTSYTYTRRPVKCVFVSEPMEPSQAIEFEKQVKGWNRKKKEALINDQWELLPELSVSYSKKKIEKKN